VPLRELCCKVQVYTIANGCDPSDLEKIGSETRAPGKEDDFVIQYLGRMDRNHKGLDLLIRGFAEFASRRTPESRFRLVLSGNDWEDREFLESLADQLSLGDRIEFTGRLEEHSLRIHSRADLSVLCSRFDGFGLTLVEAMLAGRPVLVSSEAGISGFVGRADAGFVVAPEVGEIADGLESAWEMRDHLEEMGERGRRFVLENLTWEAVAQKSRELYGRVFAKSPMD